MKIKGTTAVVTGAGGGLGTCLAGELVSRGAARVYAGGRTAYAVQHVVELDPERVQPLTLDITDDSQAKAAAKTAPDANLVFNNAGVNAFSTPLEADPMLIRRDFDTNVIGMLYVTRAFAPVLERNGGGAFVNTLSLLALAPVTAMSPYCLSKAAGHSLTQALRNELSARRIAVLGVYPGPMDTPMMDGIDAPKARPEEVAKAILDATEAGTEDVMPDQFSADSYGGLSSDPKSLERTLSAF